MHAFGRAVHAGDLAAAGEHAPRAFELMREDPSFIVVYRRWAEQLLAASKAADADAALLAYLQYLAACDQSALRTQNSVLFVAALLQAEPAVAAEFRGFFQDEFSGRGSGWSATEAALFS